MTKLKIMPHAVGAYLKGVGVESVELDAHNHFIVYLDNGETADAGEFKVDDALSSTSSRPLANKTIMALKGALETMISRTQESIDNRINALVGNNATTAIDNFNEIISFFEGVTDSETLVAKIAEINVSIAAEQSRVNDELANRVEKITGKGLSSNDYTDGEKAMVNSVRDGSAITKHAGKVAEIIVDNTDSEVTPKGNKPVSGKGVAEAITKATGSIDDKLAELSTETSHKVFSNGAIFNSIFSEVYFIGFSKDEIASITRVAYGLLGGKEGQSMLSITINGVIERFAILAPLSYSSGINYFGLINGDQREGKRGVFVISNGKWADEGENIQIYSSVLDIAQSPSIAEHILELTPNNEILVNLEFAGTSKRIHKDGYIADANSSWAYTKPISVTKGDLLKIHTKGNINTAVLAKTNADESYYETIISYNDQTNDYQLLIDFDGYVALSIYVGDSYHLYQVQSPIIKAVVSLIGEQPTESVSVQSIEQIVTSTESGGVNVIECTLTNGTRTQFYIRNGIGENGSIAVPNFNNIQLLPQRKFKKPIVAIKATDMKWTPTMASDATIESTPREVYDEVYYKMNKVEWVNSTSKASMVYDLPSRIDMTKKVICGSIYLDEDIANTATMGVTLVKIYSGGVNDTAHSLFVQIQFAGSGNEAYQRTGWFHFCVCPQANAYSKGASFDIADVHRIAIHQLHTSASVQFGIGDFYIVDGMQKGGVVMLIDNFNPNVPTMADYIASKGLKATLSIVPSWIGNDSLHGTLEQINKCAADGHLIINHTWTHNISNDQTAEDIFDEISKADKWMVRNGFARGSKIVSNPSAAHDLNKYRAYMDSEALMIYHHWTTQGKDSNFTLYYPYYPMSRLLNITALESSGVDYMINAVDKAVEVGGIAVLGWHGTWYDKTNGEADFKRLIDHIASLGSECTCYLVDDLIEGTYL